MPENNMKSAIEALLFASDKPLLLEQIKKVLDGPGLADIQACIEELSREYEQSNRGIRLAEIAGGYQITTCAGFAPFLKKLFKERNAERLSKPALETLAIIAYKQPITKSEIELLRNVNIDGVVASLVEKGMIRIAGRKKVPGRPYVFGTTRQFLEHFGLKSLEELPKIEELKEPGRQQESLPPQEEKTGVENESGVPA